jgi:phosphoglucosamine mutase
MVDATGRVFNGDELLYVMVAERLASGQKVDGAVGTLMTNMAIELALRARDVPLVRAKVGDRYILEELASRHWLLGGEGSGHLLALDKHTTGDGIISSLQVLQAICHSGRSLAQQLQGVSLFPQTLINVRLAPDVDWKANRVLAAEQVAVQRDLADTGRVLIRASGTEPLLRVMVEASDAELARGCAERLARAAVA